MPVADTIVCVDCGGTCHRIPIDPPELGWHPGDVVTYRCADCVDMWYLEVDEEDVEDVPPQKDPVVWTGADAGVPLRHHSIDTEPSA